MFSLSNLIKFLHETLVFTEDLKNVLKLNCDEAMFCLKPWCIEVVSQQEISKDACICPKSETEIEEIATGINRALLQTQQLREKLSTNVVAEKKSVFRMYDCSQENEQRKVRSFRASAKLNLYSTKGGSQKVALDKRVQNEVGKRNVDVKNKETKNDNKRSVANPVKLTENKNFLAINKRSIKHMADVRKQKETHYELENNPKSSSSIIKTNCMKFTERHSAASTSELKSLIQKVSNKSNSSTISSEHIIKCPLYVDISSPPIYKQSSISMNIIDGLNMTNIPGEIIKSLKIYHMYLDVENSKKSSNEKQERILHKFLTEFNTMDKLIQEKLANRNYHMVSLPKFMCLFRPLFSTNLDCTNLMNIKTTYAELNPTCKVYEMEFNSGQIYKSDATKWILNGIWNSEYSGSFKGMSKACCIRYTKNDELLLFFNTMQQLQGTQYYRKLLKIITEDVLPYMESSFEPTQLEYAKMYKMIFILYQGLQSKVPVLVRTDK